MTSGGLAIDLSGKLNEVTSTGIVAGYRMPFTGLFYRSWFPRYLLGLKSTPPPTPRHGASCQEARLARVNRFYPV